MSKYVIDTNIVMSILISGKSQYTKLLSYFDFVFPQYLLTELDEYKGIVKEKTKLDDQQFQKYCITVFSFLTVIPSIIVTQKSLDYATKLCELIDFKDISFVALSIETGYVLLTRDEKLFTGLKKAGYRDVMLFENFLNDLYKMQ
jgi:predicted nucleic acid-binding protein